MTRFLLILITAVLLISCKADDIPSNVLPPEKMEAVLWDLIRVDQALSIQYTTDTTVNRTLKSTQMYQQVLSLHKISEANFKESLRFYEQHPKHLKPILDSLRVKPADSVIPNVKLAQ